MGAGIRDTLATDPEIARVQTPALEPAILPNTGPATGSDFSLSQGIFEFLLYKVYMLPGPSLCEQRRNPTTSFISLIKDCYTKGTEDKI